MDDEGGAAEGELVQVTEASRKAGVPGRREPSAFVRARARVGQNGYRTHVLL